MEEIVTTDAIQKEILDDARKKAEHLLHEADEEVARAVASAEERKSQAVAEIARANEVRVSRHKAETQARVPLEKTRLKTQLVDGRIRTALAAFMARLPEEGIAELSGRFVQEGGHILMSKELIVRYRGLSASRATSIVLGAIKGAKISTCREDLGIAAPGLVLETVDGEVTLKATMDLVEESLMNRRRGELARALCAEALKL